MTKCQKCHKNLNLGSQMKEWDEQYGSEWVGSAMVNIICKHCGEGVILVDLICYDETEEVESIIGKVKIPKLKKHAKH
jgi:hypothetical protein